MQLDTILTLLNVVWGLVLTGIGIEMVNNPPNTSGKKWAYRILFIVFGGAVVVTTAVQTTKNQTEQANLRREAAATETALSNKVSEESGKLDAIAHFEQQFLAFASQRPSGTSDKAYEAMATAVLRLAQGSSGQTAPPGGNLQIICNGKELNGQEFVMQNTANGAIQLPGFHTKNIGTRTTGQVSVRIFFSKPVGSTGPGWMVTDSEEPGYPVAYWSSGGIIPIMVNPTETWNWEPFLGIYPNWPAGEVITARVKFFYGKDKPAEATFTLRR